MVSIIALPVGRVSLPSKTSNLDEFPPLKPGFRNDSRKYSVKTRAAAAVIVRCAEEISPDLPSSPSTEKIPRHPDAESIILSSAQLIDSLVIIALYYQITSSPSTTKNFILFLGMFLFCIFLIKGCFLSIVYYLNFMEKGE